MKKGTIVLDNGNKLALEFYPEAAPGTVENFEKLANEGFYDGLTFHRVIPGFVAQGGCPIGNGTGGSDKQIKCETKGNPHKHVQGTLSMAHAGKDTGSSQFFIVHEPQPHLDGVHTVFGQVTEGIEAVLDIKAGDVMQEVRVFNEE
ncbi:peptidylprolyl isomerase [Alteribacter aurantiacus]|uniref:peptidylprolyl isomerase n=1 Tax=Alteribacter aurantiacus TaxID=254410 RepID=UPI00041DF34F|nr:peptidylprolyl isomerase [Alteribacter aurantiacus]